MLIGIPKEIKNHEYRVGMIPANVRELIAAGHEVIVEHNAAIGIGFTDEDYSEQVDAIGDIAVVLTNLAELAGPSSVEDCIGIAYNVISKRKGKMINGTYIKND